MLVGEHHTFRWVVLTMAAVTNGLTWGLLYSVGLLYSSWLEYFDESASYVAMAGSLPLTLGCVGGPLFRPVANALGLRWGSFVGGVLMGCGIGVSFFARSVFTLCFTFGIMGGLGAGLSNFCASMAVNEYFYRKRSLAEGIMGAGLSIGMFVLALMQQYFISKYTWQGTMLLTGGMCFHLSLVGLFFISPKEISNHPLNLWGESNATRIAQQTLREEFKAIENVVEEANNNIKEDVPKSRWNFVKLCCNPTFVLILTSDFLSWIALYVPYVHLNERARIQGIDSATSAWLSPACGFGGLVGRPGIGYICDRLKIHPFWAYAVVQMLCGVGTFLSPLWSTKEGLFVYAVYFGIFSSGYGLIKASAGRMIGPSNFTDAFSWMLLSEGVGICLGPTIGGAIYDASHSYDWTFRFAGVCLIVSSLICGLKPLISKGLVRNVHSKNSAVNIIG